MSGGSRSKGENMPSASSSCRHVARCAAFGLVLAACGPAIACPNCVLCTAGAVANDPHAWSALGTGNSGGGGASGPASGRGGELTSILMLDNVFDPVSVIVKPSSFVRWTNIGTDPHSATFYGTFDSDFLLNGETYEFEFTPSHAGLLYHYICVLHPEMIGDLGVANYGDANLDGHVDLLDFNVLATNFGAQGGGWSAGDFNEDGNIDLLDFNLLASHFGQDLQPAPNGLTPELNGVSVPEPAAAMLFTSLGMLSRARRRKRARLGGILALPVRVDP
jgi:plastocyanin